MIFCYYWLTFVENPHMTGSLRQPPVFLVFLSSDNHKLLGTCCEIAWGTGNNRLEKLLWWYHSQIVLMNDFVSFFFTRLNIALEIRLVWKMSHQENSSNHRTQNYFFMGLLIDSNCLQVLRLEPYMGEDVPVRWFNFERVVEALVQQKIFYLKISQLYFIVSKTCLIEDEAEMVAMLDFYHDLGIIIWHGDTVVLQTQWLIHLFRKLITIRPFDEQVYCWSFRKDSILLFDTVKPFLLDTSCRRSNKLVPRVSHRTSWNKWEGETR